MYRGPNALWVENSIGLQGPNQVIPRRRVAVDDTRAGKQGIDQHVPAMRRKRQGPRHVADAGDFRVNGAIGMGAHL
uniref:hypothetical protein n=1 Tax=Paenibacillus nasutitermitis TaxID=1652958 RepID=UPI001E349BD5|nr:hypothetical protein [Paenibacillus nasutitermitis]